MPQPALDIATVFEVGTAHAQGVSARGLDANDIRAEIGQEAAREAETLIAEIDHHRPDERERGLRH